MRIAMKLTQLCTLALCLSPAVFAQQSPPAPPATAPPSAAPQTEPILLSVVVTDTSGKPETGLTAQDFVVFNNKRPTEITYFRAVDPSVNTNAPAEIVIVIDAVNNTALYLQYVEDQLRTRLARSGTLSQPWSLIFFSDPGGAAKSPVKYTQMVGPTTDPKVLLEGLNTIGRVGPNAGQLGNNGPEQRVMLSLQTIYSIAAEQARRPGRKSLLWISHGWPMLAGEDKKSQPVLFNSIVAIADRLRKGQITLYDLDPSGAGNGGNVFRTNTVSNQMGHFAVQESTQATTDTSHLYEAYLKGVSSPSQVKYDHLALPVLAIKSGGELFNQQNDVLREIDDCIAYSNSYYLLTIASPKASAPNEYHDIEVKLHKRIGKVRTLTGYYSQP
jgi:VWFA-related protein